MLHAFATWLSQTSVAWFVKDSGWVWPACETLHFIGLSLLIGVAGLFDLRLIGFFRSLPVAAVHRLMPFAIAGFAINLFTGILFFVGDPMQYVDNSVFWWKMGFVVLAGINAMLFERLISKRALRTGAGEYAPLTARLIGACSLFSWFAVLYCGRMLPYLGNAF